MRSWKVGMECIACGAPSFGRSFCRLCDDFGPLDDLEDADAIREREFKAAAERAWEKREARKMAARARRALLRNARKVARSLPKRPGIVVVVASAPVLRKRIVT